MELQRERCCKIGVALHSFKINHFQTPIRLCIPAAQVLSAGVYSRVIAGTLLSCLGPPRLSGEDRHVL